MTIGLPHFSQVRSVGSSIFLMFSMLAVAALRSLTNCLWKSFKASTKSSRPSSISSSSSSMRAVYLASRMEEELDEIEEGRLDFVDEVEPALLDLVELLLHARRVLDVEDVLEV